MMLNGVTAVCLTGPAFDANGQVVLRASLVAACKAAGIRVDAKVLPTTQLLVASRKDTVKALQALSRGLQVTDYPTFIQSLPTAPQAPKAVPRHKYVDTHKQHPMPVPPMPRSWEDQL